jgi:hypothetical protein
MNKESCLYIKYNIYRSAILIMVVLILYIIFLGGMKFYDAENLSGIFFVTMKWIIIFLEHGNIMIVDLIIF